MPKTRHPHSVELGHLEFMTHPDGWPNWPILPLKNYKQKKEGMGGLPRVACLFNGGEKTKFSIAYDINMWMLVEKQRKGEVKWTELTIEQVKALVAEGWEVD